MNWDRIEGNWKQFKGNAMQQWGKLTDDQLDVIAGKRDVLLGRIQELYGISKDAGREAARGLGEAHGAGRHVQRNDRPSAEEIACSTPSRSS